MESQQTLGKSTQQTGTLQNSLTTCLICRPGAAGAPGWRQQGPAKQAHTRLNEIRLALLHFVLVSACSPNEPCMVYAWTRTFLPSTSRVWTSQCVSVGLGSTLLVGMVQWDQRVQGECVKPVCDFRALLDHHLRGETASSTVLGKDAEPQVCVQRGADGVSRCADGGKAQEELEGDSRWMESARNTLCESGRHTDSPEQKQTTEGVLRTWS